ncbi:hypothetical protein [Desulfosporosinus sp. SB140]|uniref:hypothetical protein n=1 Tax=Desulfosporosinus paludis TaxID=3115649 RepID=UPI00388F3B94
MSTKSVKLSIQAILQGVAGVKSVYTYLPRVQQGSLFPSIVITLEKVHEKVASMGNPGRRQIHYVASLYIQTIDPDPNGQALQDRFDDMLDAIDVTLRANKDLGGTVLKSAYESIDTDSFLPQEVAGSASMLMRAIKTFDVTVEITG